MFEVSPGAPQHGLGGDGIPPQYFLQVPLALKHGGAQFCILQGGETEF